MLHSLSSVVYFYYTSGINYLKPFTVRFRFGISLIGSFGNQIWLSEFLKY